MCHVAAAVVVLGAGVGIGVDSGIIGGVSGGASGAGGAAQALRNIMPIGRANNILSLILATQLFHLQL